MRSLSSTLATSEHCRPSARQAALGFTLIELLLYVGIASLILVGTVRFAWDLFYVQVKSDAQVLVNQDLRLLTQRMELELREASGINSLSGSDLELANPDSAKNPTQFSLSGGRVYIGQSNSGDCPISSPCPLTSNQTEVTSLQFTDLSSGDSQQVQYELTLQHQNPGNRQELDVLVSQEGSAELRVKP